MCARCVRAAAGRGGRHDPRAVGDGQHARGQHRPIVGRPARRSPVRGVLYGYAIESERPVARLRDGPAPRGRIVLSDAPVPQPAPHGTLLGYVEDPRTGRSAYAMARTGAGLVAICATTGTHTLDVEHATVVSDPGSPPAAWEDRAVCALVPALLAERGELMVHATAVRTAAGAVLVCGPSGRGKSTLAATFDAAGLPMLADDVIGLTLDADAVLAWPGPLGAAMVHGPGTLTPRGKHLRPAGTQHGADPVPLAAIVALEPRTGGPPNGRLVSNADALAWMFPNVLRPDLQPRPSLFATAAEVVRRVPCHRVSLTDDLDAVAAGAQDLLDQVGSTNPWATSEATHASASA